MKGYMKLKKINIIIFILITFSTMLSKSYSMQTNSIAPLINEVKNSVVAIKNINPKYHNNLSGSGFFIDENGLIVTNYHVVKNSSQIEVLSNSSVYKAKIIGYDEKYDIALLKINADKIFEFVEFADSSKIQIGDFIIAVGNPFGLGGTVTTGIISALNRNINMSPYDNFIQIDAAINKGNSGGPTFNMEGKVIGVNTAIISPTGGNVGLGFSVPSNDVKRIISDIQKYGYVKRSWVGISLQELNAEMLQSLDIKDLLPRSVIITNIAPNSPAENYNLEIGDVIYQINNQKIYNINDLVKHIAKIKVNELIKISVFRDKKLLEISLKTSEWPDKKTAKVLSKNIIISNYEIIEQENNLIISKVINKNNNNNKIKKGDILTHVNNIKVNKLKELKLFIKTHKPKSKVLFLLKRKNYSFFVPVEIA